MDFTDKRFTCEWHFYGLMDSQGLSPGVQSTDSRPEDDQREALNAGSFIGPATWYCYRKIHCDRMTMSNLDLVALQGVYAEIDEQSDLLVQSYRSGVSREIV